MYYYFPQEAWERAGYGRRDASDGDEGRRRAEDGKKETQEPVKDHELGIFELLFGRSMGTIMEGVFEKVKTDAMARLQYDRATHLEVRKYEDRWEIDKIVHFIHNTWVGTTELEEYLSGYLGEKRAEFEKWWPFGVAAETAVLETTARAVGEKVVGIAGTIKTGLEASAKVGEGLSIWSYRGELEARIGAGAQAIEECGEILLCKLAEYRLKYREEPYEEARSYVIQVLQDTSRTRYVPD